jgi:guanylate kinase
VSPGGTATAAGPATGLVFILSGPSGVGKDTITKFLRTEGFPLGYCVTATTRPPRPGEINGLHYLFLSDQEFAALRAAGGLLEHAEVHGRNYGIPIENLRAALRGGQDVMVTPDVQGAATLRGRLKNAITIFLAPPTLEELAPRLANRNSETLEERALRLETAAREMERQHEYDYVVVNERGRVDESVAKIKAIIIAERARVHPRLVTL